VIDNAAFTLAVPQAPQPLLSPLLSVVAGQLFAAALARAKGLDPDRPERLTKVTLAL
jgi:glucosamine--fructose-6-phosphate aminotransferase (isomerizing)